MIGFVLRILVQICKTRAFQKLNPAQFDLHYEVNEAIQVSNHTNEYVLMSKCIMSLVTYHMTFISDRYAGVVYHQKGFASAND